MINDHALLKQRYKKKEKKRNKTKQNKTKENKMAPKFYKDVKSSIGCPEDIKEEIKNKLVDLPPGERAFKALERKALSNITNLTRDSNGYIVNLGDCPLASSYGPHGGSFGFGCYA